MAATFAKVYTGSRSRSLESFEILSRQREQYSLLPIIEGCKHLSDFVP